MYEGVLYFTAMSVRYTERQVAHRRAATQAAQ